MTTRDEIIEKAECVGVLGDRLTYKLIVEPLHDDVYPLKLGWTEFIGSGGEGKHQRMRGVVGVIHSYKAAKMLPKKKLATIDDDYDIYEARYSTVPAQNLKLLGVYGPGVVAMVGNTLVGAARKHYVYVDPQHHGHRLGAEMAITWLLYFGYEVWRFRQEQQYQMTDFAVALRIKQYKMMEERGIVVNTDEGEVK